MVGLLYHSRATTAGDGRITKGEGMQARTQARQGSGTDGPVVGGYSAATKQGDEHAQQKPTQCRRQQRPAPHKKKPAYRPHPWRLGSTKGAGRCTSTTAKCEPVPS